MPVRSRPDLPPGEVFVTRQVHFSASHRLCNPRKSAVWNQREYGDCANARGHGHNYVLEVTVAGVPNPETGYLLNLRTLKAILGREIVEPCDHRHLNEDVAFLVGIVPTTENLAIAFWRRVAPHIKTGRLHQLRLYETPRNFADYFGP
ncbi:MAG TPA: 6-carboxytetrahydropterin synthase [Opitutaceae bacterium]|jgi:6-pyruvoyltetrahydropterin/6-carboxytetrahydropterin synthase